MESVFGKANNTLTFIGTIRDEGQTLLGFKTNQFQIDEVAEEEMLDLLNAERIKRGISPLRVDILIRNVSRAHSMDMLQQGYFAHEDLSGKTPSERMADAGVEFTVGGENLALAPTYELAHLGLMNSQGHRENILNTEYTRVGIGILDAGIYGTLITQSFAN